MYTKTNRTIGIVLAVLGALFIVVGGTAWGITTSQLKSQNMTVPADSPMMAGKSVGGPFTAYAMQNIINIHSMNQSEAASGVEGGATYAELGALSNAAREAGDTEKADKLTQVRTTVMNGQLLRGSIFTSILAYGVSLFAIGVGFALILIGVAVKGKKPEEAVVVNEGVVVTE